MKKLTIILSLIFVFFSFYPSVFEIYHAEKLPQARAFVLEHNYLFDYNFYLSRIRQGQEGRWMVVEKYYNLSHNGSLFQIFYLLLGKAGGMLRLSPPVIYHLSRLFLGFILLILIGCYTSIHFSGWWRAAAYLLIITSGSWPILVKVGSSWRFATYMGWWSVVDSLQRITFIPHILLGQIFLLLFIWRVDGGFSLSKSPKVLKLIMWGAVGFVAGIIFPPTLVVVYMVFVILSVMEIAVHKSFRELRSSKNEWLREKLLPRLVFALVSFPSFVYLQLMFKVLPWSALALFDVENRMLLPYKEYALSLGPILPLGVAGLTVALIKKEKKLFPAISWVLALGLLFAVFEHVPWQSPLRFTEAAINIPLGILATYFFTVIWQVSRKYTHFQQLYRFHTPGEPKSDAVTPGVVKVIRGVTGSFIVLIILMGAGVMVSTVGWLTDQVKAKAASGWLVPVGAQLAYPLSDFMAGVNYIRDNTKREEAVLAYITAGNYIPAYAGNFVYLGHANTPKEKDKEGMAAKFFSGKMGQNEAREFLIRERISYIYFGPQEKELGGVTDLAKIYPFVSPIYSNKQVVIYRVR